MMSNQLGRVILGGSKASEDEMSASPDPDGGYGPMDGLLAEIAVRARVEMANGGDRRPGSSTSAD